MTEYVKIKKKIKIGRDPKTPRQKNYDDCWHNHFTVGIIDVSDILLDVG